MKEQKGNRRHGTGIIYKHRPGRSSPFLLGWDDGTGHQWQSFATEAERETAAAAMLDKREGFGREVLDFDPREWRAWQAFKAKIGDADPMQVAQEWLAGRGGSSESVTVGIAVTRYLAHRAEGGGLSPDTTRHFKKHLEERFAATHAGLKLHLVTADVIRDWLKSLVHPKTGARMEPVTIRHHRKDVNTFLEWCVAEGLILRNPCASVAVPEVPEQDVAILLPAETRRLFEANAGARVLYRMAFEAWGFMRPSSAGRIQKADIDFKARGIRMRGAEHKSGKKKYRQGHPANLWAWLDAAPDEAWGMKWWEYRNEKRVAFAVAKLGDSENRLKKTCLSAHLAWLKNPPLTSYLAQHRHTSTTEIYVGEMNEADAKAHFQIYPPKKSSK